ncbi:hypothetical protein CONPUDRAFT_117312 [Coniophora puteana RWD-64-598 SS2]|uniref:SRR1-like domain-containing protein n=1 Tax=Coniophora puteana (strain RWD-64-598) TaxID=741705 RepID=A0A5M3N225_CONPW|nr:uncharacterized protein CONPUDRAFT_117312 [Coniophora puteana RWD-64-598 SS2]EIW84975.1 hypothetical protein CONPUDRAFT_117312 [Coniophora puteana RWD-64-598 SS2]
MAAMSQSTSFSYAETFTPVRSRKKRKAKANTPESPLLLLDRTKRELESDAGTWTKECQELVRAALADADIREPDVLCLGLGSPTASHNSRAQLAFLIQLCNFLDIHTSKVTAYDPAFTDADRGLLTDLDVRCLTENTENKAGTHPIGCPTILYLPHCDLWLYERIVRENWSPVQLGRVVFIANRFKDYVDNIPAAKMNKQYPCLTRFVPMLEAVAIPASVAYPTAFNSLAIQFVNKSSLPSPDDAFWTLPDQGSD